MTALYFFLFFVALFGVFFAIEYVINFTKSWPFEQ